MQRDYVRRGGDSAVKVQKPALDFLHELVCPYSCCTSLHRCTQIKKKVPGALALAHQAREIARRILDVEYVQIFFLCKIFEPRTADTQRVSYGEEDTCVSYGDYAPQPRTAGTQLSPMSIEMSRAHLFGNLSRGTSSGKRTMMRIFLPKP
jgi:hypothetical protein